MESENKEPESKNELEELESKESKGDDNRTAGVDEEESKSENEGQSESKD